MNRYRRWLIWHYIPILKAGFKDTAKCARGFWYTLGLKNFREGYKQIAIKYHHMLQEVRKDLNVKF